MVVICPNCSKRYMLDEALLPQEGRQVRCIACHHVWRQNGEKPLYTPPPLLGREEVARQRADFSEKKSSWVGWLVCLAILSSCVSTIIFARNFIVGYWPESEKYYEFVHLQVTPPGTGLAIANASSQIYREGSVDMIRIMGEMINTSDRARPVPPLQVKLIGDASSKKCLAKDKAGGCVLDYWEHRLSESSLLPGEKIQFETQSRPKVEGTQHIRVEF